MGVLENISFDNMGGVRVRIGLIWEVNFVFLIKYFTCEGMSYNSGGLGAHRIPKMVLIYLNSAKVL